MRANKNLARFVGIAAVLAGVAVAGTEAKAATVNIFAWTNAAPLPFLLGSGPSGTSVAGSTGGAAFSSITGTFSAPTLLDSAQTLTLDLTGTLASPVHIAVEVAGLTSPFVTGALTFLSGFAVSNILSGLVSPLSVAESTHLGSVCTANPAVGGQCAARAANLLLSTHTFVGPSGADSNNQVAQGITGNPYTVFDEFVFSGGTAGDSANVNITLRAVPGPVVGAGLPGLLAACGGLLGLARRRRRKAAA
jgi:hypothetical protein